MVNVTLTGDLDNYVKLWEEWVTQFSKLALYEKLEIILTGQPSPNLLGLVQTS